MSTGCIKATKYFLFLFNLLFFILGAVILGFGLWIQLDKTSFIAVLESSSVALKTGSFILIGVGSVTMLMGFLGCIGAVNEIKCLLGLYFTCLLLILIAQIAAGVLIYVQRDMLKEEMSSIVHKVILNYNPDDGESDNAEQTWDYIQKHLRCCGWNGPQNWTQNVILNSTKNFYPCSCGNATAGVQKELGFCETDEYEEWPVYSRGCMESVEEWLLSNIGIILGVCIGVAVVELLGMILSMYLCKSVQTEDYTKVPKY
uniref:Tetraspanin n=2 Tax=Latimeria chalumnae TaxID=7897 RepID=H3BEQ7_LATCH|nr:PREDICTED: CD82 antigen isoform X2 [Latimeria chalumnae]XP_005986978.1 PREDICTED: CD82 antigen isoform X2 [Latimeria chalumnae]|eukprot:XP_005986977.1 PREDICTED: CD82 antigen isoform X2 [Latimeria chalumnae]